LFYLSMGTGQHTNSIFIPRNNKPIDYTRTGCNMCIALNQTLIRFAEAKNKINLLVCSF
jgi:hypothetical protein